MIDQQLDRDYQASRKQLNTAIATIGRRLLSEAVVVFAAIHRVNFSAPWIAPRPH